MQSSIIHTLALSYSQCRVKCTNSSSFNGFGLCTPRQVAADIFCPHQLYLQGENMECFLWLLFQREGERRFPGPGDATCAHGQARVAAGTAKAWHCHVPAPRARGTCVVTSRALLHLWHPGISGSQRGEEPSSMCSQLPFGHHFATNGSAACLVGAGVTRITSRRAGITHSRMLSSSHHSLISLSHCAGCCSSHLNGGRENNFNSATKRWLLLLPSLLPAPAVP